MNNELLRFTTAGSVDDGKSTLIGRLLYDSKQIFQDQLEALEHACTLRGHQEIDLALLCDGLRAEREQGITIDVAYRYFTTTKRKFIIADTPGHEQYTRNMVTGASTADLAIVLIDARKGVLTQSKRHAFISSLLGIRHVLVAVNKMDLVAFGEKEYQTIVSDFTDFVQKLNIYDIVFIPISALHGDNVVSASEKMPWYDGPTVLHHLEQVTIASDKNLVDFRFPVQYVIRPNQDFRGFAGKIVSGTIKKGEEIVALPSGRRSKVKELIVSGDFAEEAFESQAVVLSLTDEIDISRGEMIVRKDNVPHITEHFDAVVCWMDDKHELNANKTYIFQHTTRVVHGHIAQVRYRIDVNTLHRETAPTLSLNEIGRVEIKLAQPVFCDPYDRNRVTGSFIIVDPVSNRTVGAGMIRADMQTADQIFHEKESFAVSDNVVREKGYVSQKERAVKNKHRAHVLWMTGLSGAGKSTIARHVERLLFEEGKKVFVLDGDNLRHGLNGDLGFSEQDREENIRRVGHVAKLMYDAGFIVVCSFISPSRKMRSFVRNLFSNEGFSEVYIQCSLSECKKRDAKGLYARAESGEIGSFTGISSPYEEPVAPEFFVDTGIHSVNECVARLKNYIEKKIIL
jgi:bifunctional enzyme CysN/CysC